MAVRSGVCRSIDALDPLQWNRLNGAGNPFLRHEFLAALEHTGCLGPATGWEPCYFVLSDEAGLAVDGAFQERHVGQ